jgi:uncharacterized protein YcbK (DUF882 family)
MYCSSLIEVQMKYFKPEEFDSPDWEGSGVHMNKDFLETLDSMREVARIPFVITSGYRTPAHNRKVGGKSNSAHLRGYAADISAAQGFQKYAILQAALLLGIRRIGIGTNFVHVDMDPALPQPTIWTY